MTTDKAEVGNVLLGDDVFADIIFDIFDDFLTLVPSDETEVATILSDNFSFDDDVDTILVEVVSPTVPADISKVEEFFVLPFNFPAATLLLELCFTSICVEETSFEL